MSFINHVLSRTPPKHTSACRPSPSPDPSTSQSSTTQTCNTWRSLRSDSSTKKPGFGEKQQVPDCMSKARHSQSQSELPRSKRRVEIVDILGNGIVTYHLTTQRDVYVHEILHQLVGEEDWFKYALVLMHGGKVMEASDMFWRNGKWKCRVVAMDSLKVKSEFVGFMRGWSGNWVIVERPQMRGLVAAFERVVDMRSGEELPVRELDVAARAAEISREREKFVVDELVGSDVDDFDEPPPYEE